MSPVYHGAGRDLDRLVTTHLFIVSRDHSGSTFLQQALATCRATWNLPLEGRQMLGFVGPEASRAGGVGWWDKTGWTWDERRWLAAVTDSDAYDWPRTRKAWYFQAFANDPQASVFVEKSPPWLFCVDDARHFRNPKFLFLVRNPYAVCEGICRSVARRLRSQGRTPPASLPTLAAQRTVTGLVRQRYNLEQYGDRGAFFSYEAMCAAPERVARDVRALVPELADLNLRRRLPVKGQYHDMLTDMNARQIARLSAEQVAAFSRVFHEHREELRYFGYEVFDATDAGRVRRRPVRASSGRTAKPSPASLNGGSGA